MKIKSIIKFIILVAIFYALLAFNVFHIGEKLVPSSKEYLHRDMPTEDQDIEEAYFNAISEQESTGHFAAEVMYENFLRNLCNRITFCDKIILSGEFTTYDRYGYIRAITALVEFFDKHSKQEKKLQDTIKIIQINNETGTRRGYATRDTIIINL